jgi:hypothetical protein
MMVGFFNLVYDAKVPAKDLIPEKKAANSAEKSPVASN